VIVDADVIARDVVAPGTPGLQQVVDAFGSDALAADGSLDRAKMAALVFNDADALQRLNGILHPLIFTTMAQRTVRAGEHDPHAVVVNDVALLVERGGGDRYDVVVVVDVDPDTQLQRLVGQRGMSEADARARISAQATREQRVAAADIVIENTGSLDDLDRRVREVWVGLQARAQG
jgi:dephospho-CoA kinase